MDILTYLNNGDVYFVYDADDDITYRVDYWDESIKTLRLHDEDTNEKVQVGIDDLRSGRYTFQGIVELPVVIKKEIRATK